MVESVLNEWPNSSYSDDDVVVKVDDDCDITMKMDTTVNADGNGDEPPPEVTFYFAENSQKEKYVCLKYLCVRLFVFAMFL